MAEDYREKIEEIRRRRRGQAHSVADVSPGVCPECGFECGSLVGHWQAEHCQDLSSFNLRLQRLEPRPFYAIDPDLVVVELTLIHQECMAEHHARRDRLKQRLLSAMGLDCPIDFSPLGWTNHPQGSLRVFFQHTLELQSVVWPWSSAQLDRFWRALEEVCLYYHAHFRPNPRLRPRKREEDPCTHPFGK